MEVSGDNILGLFWSIEVAKLTNDSLRKVNAKSIVDILCFNFESLAQIAAYGYRVGKMLVLIVVVKFWGAVPIQLFFRIFFKII